MPTPRKGYYVNKKRVPSVTTIIGRFKDSGALMYWAFNQGKKAERGEIENLYDERDKSAEIGTTVHNLVELHVKGQLNDTVTEQFIQEKYESPIAVAKLALQGYENYLKWQESCKLNIIDQEMQLVSEEFGYGGTPDGVGIMNGEYIIIDWKCSGHVYPDYMIQLAAYGKLWEENFPDKPITGGYHLCRFSKDHNDFEHKYFGELDDAWEQFLLFRRAYEIDKKLKKRV